MKHHEIKLPDSDGQDHTYSMDQHPGEEGWALLAQLTAMASGPLGHLMAAGQQAGEGEAVNADAMAAALREVAQAIVAAGSVQLAKTVLKYTRRDGELCDSAFASAYQGNFGELITALGWVLWCNYGSVLNAPFGKLLDLAGKRV